MESAIPMIIALILSLILVFAGIVTLGVSVWATAAIVIWLDRRFGTGMFS
jgi:hypothetical protein